MKNLVTTIALSFGLVFVWAQTPEIEAPSFLVPEPPAEPVRTMAEWEEVQAVIITWTDVPDVLTEIVRHAVQECQVIIITETPDFVTAYLTAANIPLDNVQLLNRPFNTIWVRDYGPWTVYTNEIQDPTLIDWIYNRPLRRADDTLPQAIAEHFDITLHEATEAPFDWVHAGGNHLVDGLGTAFSSELVIDENPFKTEAEIDAIAAEYLGIQNYIKLPKLPYDGIHHLDMHMRLLDEETLLVGEYPEGVADGPQIEANLQKILTTLTTPFGHPYRVIRIPMPPDRFGNYPDEISNYPCRNGNRDFGCYRTYTNSLFINKTVLVPIYGHPMDSLALDIYEQALPGHNIVGIDCNDIIPQIGAIHCITKLIGSTDPLWIAHPRLPDTYGTVLEYPVFAKIRHQSGILSAYVHYRTTGEPAFQSMPMVLVSSEQHLWSANIPAVSAGQIVEYYISATALSGKEQQRPMTAPEGYFRFAVKQETVAPTASFAQEKKALCAATWLHFADQSTNGATSWSWSFPGGSPATSNIPNPIVFYENAGVYPVSLTVSNAIGSNTISLPEAVEVLPVGQAPFMEAFENVTPEHWEVINPTQDEASWESVQTNCSGNSFRLNNYTHKTWGTSDLLRSHINANELEDLQLHFDVAYALHANSMEEDRLQVNLIDCSGKKFIVYSKTGPALATTSPSNHFFIPTSCADWRKETVDLSGFSGQTFTLEFENVGFNGNMLYIDNIDLESSSIPNQAPNIALDQPAGGTSYLDELPVLQLQADAYDVDGIVDSVNFFLNDLPIGTSSNYDFTLNYQIPAFGNYTLRAKATDNDGAIAWSKAIEIMVDQSTKLREIVSPSYQFTVFPIPAKQVLQTQVQGDTPTTFEIQITDVFGKQIQLFKWDYYSKKEPFQVDVSTLTDGTYLLSLYWQDGYYHHTFVVQK